MEKPTSLKPQLVLSLLLELLAELFGELSVALVEEFIACSNA
jgi:hypothetical protein